MTGIAWTFDIDGKTPTKKEIGLAKSKVDTPAVKLDGGC
jgi:hypothetical protein